MPELSREVRSILRYLDDSGVPHRVTATLGRYVSPQNPCAPHTAHSNHCADGTDGKGLAVDFGGMIPGTGAAAVAQMAAIWNAFKPVAPQLAELFFNGPGITSVVKNGVWRNALQTLGAETWAAHKTHVHVAVPRGVFLTSASAEPARASGVVPAGPAPVHDYEENTVKTTMMVIGPLDSNGCGWSSWDPGFARDPVVVAATLHGPNPPADGYWTQQANVTLAAQPHGGTILVTVRNGRVGDSVTAWVTVA